MIGIICATENEMNPIKQHMIIKKSTVHALLTIHEGSIADKEVVLLYSGVCKVNAALATQLIIDTYKPHLIIMSGVAGSIDEKVKIFDTVIATHIAHHDVDAKILTEYHPWLKDIWFIQNEEIIEKCKLIEEDKNKVFYGRIISGENFIEKNQKELLREKYNSLAVDMESASVAQVSYANKIPLLVVRTITDTCDENGIKNFEANVAKSSMLSSEFVIKYISRFC